MMKKGIEEEEEEVALLSKLIEEQGIELEEKVALLSKVIEEQGIEVEEEEEEVAFLSDSVIPLPLEYCPTANSSPLSTSSAAASSESFSSYSISSKPVSDSALSAWDKEIVKLNPSSLYDLFRAATLADMISGKEPGGIHRLLLHVKNDFPPKEKEAGRRKNSWIFKY